MSAPGCNMADDETRFPPPPPRRNGLYIVSGELSQVVGAMRRSTRHSRAQDDEQDPVLHSFNVLKEILSSSGDLKEIQVNVFLSPFLDVIRSEDTTGPLTGIALSAVNKFLSYGLIDGSSIGIENLADAVTHARFVGTDSSSDEVVLMKILQVLRTLLLTPIGRLMTNESVCEIMQSCFRICFESRLSELLRKSAEHTLVDMVQLLFQRLKSFKEDTKVSVSVDTSMRKVLKRGMSSAVAQSIVTHSPTVKRRGEEGEEEEEEENNEEEREDEDKEEKERKKEEEENKSKSPDEKEDDETSENGTYVNRRGIKFTQKKTGPLLPYGLPCVRELFRFLVSLINPRERHNTERMIQMGLSLLTVALECGCEAVGSLNSMMQYVQDDLCKHLFQLLKSENSQVFSHSIRISLLLFESLRDNLKFQLEKFLIILMNVIGKHPAGGKFSASFIERKEMALECCVQLCKIPYFVTELYLNFDADLYSSNVFEELTKLLSKNAYPSGHLHPSHLLCLDALLAILSGIKYNCNNERGGGKNAETSDRNEDKEECSVDSKGVDEDESSSSSSSSSSSPSSALLPSPEKLIQIKQKKKLLIAGTEQFNSSPKKGIVFLQEHNVLKRVASAAVDCDELAVFFRENFRLEKKMIGEYLGDKRNENVLRAFVCSFHVKGVKIHRAIRVFLESFRLPGEAQIISRIVEHFSQHWLDMNSGTDLGKLFENTDAVFILCYAIILLNVDQHNPQNKKPMTVEQFIKNQRALNGKKDFDVEMLKGIYKDINENEIIMPDEHEGQYKDDYDWKMLLRRSSASDGHYLHIKNNEFDQDLFLLAWGPTVAALSVIFEEALDDTVLQKAVNGFKSCASVSAHYGLSDVFDNLVISLCKFTNLASTSEAGENVAVCFGANAKAQLAATTLFTLAHQHGNILREGWKNLLDCLLHLFKAKLLPEELVKTDDFLDPSGFVSIVPEDVPSQRSDSSIFSSFFSWTSDPNSGRSATSLEDREAQQKATECIRDCHPEALFAESKFLMKDSLVELIKALEFASRSPDAHHSLGTQFDEEAAVFNLELLLRVVLYNRDRIDLLWKSVEEHLTRILLQAELSSFLVQRSVIGLLRIAVRLLWREDMTHKLFKSLSVFLDLKPGVLLSVSCHIVAGLNELLRSNASYVKAKDDWLVLFTLMESCGTGTKPRDIDLAQQFVEHDSESPDGGRDSTNGDVAPLFLWRPELMKFEGVTSLGKTCDTLTFLVREVECLTSDNLPACIHVVRTLAEASCHGNAKQADSKSGVESEAKSKGKVKKSGNRRAVGKGGATAISSPKDVATETVSGYTFDAMTRQLLELMQLLHCKVATVVRRDGEGVDGKFLWLRCWGPLLQGIASFCCDSRREIRQTAVTILQRSLLIQDIQVLNASEWEACFSQIFFPMLDHLLGNVTLQDDLVGVEETCMRVSALLSKVFLQHLSALLSLTSFPDIWMNVLDFMDRFMRFNDSELLSESIPESLKNMLLVMSTAGVFDAPADSSSESPHSPLWTATWERIHRFLPGLHDQLFAPVPTRRPSLPSKDAAAKEKMEAADSGVSLSGSVVLQPPLPSSAFSQPPANSVDRSRDVGNAIPLSSPVPLILRPSSPIASTPAPAPGIAKPTSLSPQSGNSRVSSPLGSENEDDVIDI